MSDYRIELGKIVERGYDLGLKDYPIFDEEYRQVLNNKIIDHYYTYEIGFNAGMFIRKLNVKMNEIMPVYNKMYVAEQKIVNPFLTFEHEVEGGSENEHERKDSSETKSKSQGTSEESSDSKTTSLFSNTPQTQLSGEEDYASNITKGDSYTGGQAESETESESDTKSNANDSSTNSYFSKQKGYSGITQSRLFAEYVANIMNIDMLVVSELENLFVSLYSFDIGFDSFGFAEPFLLSSPVNDWRY